MIPLMVLLACKPPATAVDQGPTVRFRPAPDATEVSADAAWLVERVPGAEWDRGLFEAAQLLAEAARSPNARITPRATALALGKAGYPAPAKFARETNGGGRPQGLVETLAGAALQSPWPVDVALAKRSWGDGSTLWVGGISPRPALVDPMPRDLALDENLGVRVESELDPLTLVIAGPDGMIREQQIAGEHYLWLGGFHAPGTWRLEVVGGEGRDTTVALLWNVHVESEPGRVPSLVEPLGQPPDPIQATDALYDALNELRAEAGLRPVEPFPPFEPLAREHAAYMAAAGRVAHTLPGAPGVAARVDREFHPRPNLYEDVAAAATWQDAMDLVALSPGHLRNLLCEPCTHAAIGAAIEPTMDRVPRLFVAWELIEPNGSLPIPVDRF